MSPQMRTKLTILDMEGILRNVPWVTYPDATRPHPYFDAVKAIPGVKAYYGHNCLVKNCHKVTPTDTTFCHILEYFWNHYDVAFDAAAYDESF